MTFRGIRLGADIGGTFTDVVLELEDRDVSIKVLTTHTRPEDGILQGLQKVCDKAGITPQQIDQILHGTTLATNALIERRGAKTALITTKGFRDVIEMRTESRFEQYDLNLTLPDPLLPRDQRLVLTERVDASGKVLLPLDRVEVEALVDQIAEAGYDSVAVGFLHSYANPAHERLVAKVLAARMPGAMVSLSSDVSPQMREYERFNTTIANAYIKPLMKSYLDRLRARLADHGADCPVFLMHSGGGIISIESAAEFPVRLVESGPAGGAVFAADIAARHGISKALSFDMGGTTAKICLIRDQTPKTSRVFEVARSYRFKKGSGMPLSIPAIDMVEIGAGGGSLAHVDGIRQIRVGPKSAGSKPGPACYGRGGAHAAVTDADLTLGRLDPDNFAGGTLALEPDKSRAALSADIGAVLDLDASQAALGVSEVVDENMANAARMHAVESGEDLAGYTMIAFGGAAPLHAARLCQKLGIGRLLIPEGAGVGSAIGFLRAPFSFEATRSVFTRLAQFDPAAAGDLWRALEDEARGFVRNCDADAPIQSEHKVFMRYAGQGWEIPVEVSADMASAPDAAVYERAFEAEYFKLFGRKVQGMEIEITVWAVNATTPRNLPEALGAPAPAGRPQVAGARALIDPASGNTVAASELARAALAPGHQHPGPAIVTEDETSTVVPHGALLRALADGTLAIDFAKGETT